MAAKHPSAEEIFSADDLPFEDVPCPEWGEDAVVRIRRLAGHELAAWNEEFVDLSGDAPTLNRDNQYARFVARCAVDEAGKLLFTPDQAERLGQKAGTVLMRLYEVGQRLSGLAKDREKQLGKN